MGIARSAFKKARKSEESMENWYILGMLLVLAVLSFCIFNLKKKERNELTPYAFKILGFGILAIGLYLAIMLSGVEWFSLAAYSLYFILIDWFLYYLLHFSVAYAGKEFEKHVKRKAMLGLLWVDTALLMLNIFIPFLFTVHKVIVSGNYVYCMLEMKNGLLIHIIFSCFLLCCSMACMLYKAKKSAALYRKKYFVIFVIMILILIGNICMLLLRDI